MNHLVNGTLGGELSHALIDFVLATLAAALGWLVTWLNEHRKLTAIARKLEHSEAARDVVRSVVKAVEQISTAKKWQPIDKKNAAVRWAANLLDSKGLNVTAEELDSLIESAVLDLKNSLAGWLAPAITSTSVIEPAPADPTDVPVPDSMHLPTSTDPHPGPA